MSVIYGPVPSWRLGRSLGIDLISTQGKTCTFDCVYCQLGRTTAYCSERRVFVETTLLRAELDSLRTADADYITFSGVGEPTLAANLGEAIDLVDTYPVLKGIPKAVLTNTSLLSRSDVRLELARTDLVVAKLDAPDEMLFEVINRPGDDVSWTEVVESLRTFHLEFKGRLALQMMFTDANRDRATEMAALARSLDPEEVRLNTPLRPSPTPPLSEAEMAEIQVAFAGLPVVNVYTARPAAVRPLDLHEMRRRRPAEGHPRTARKEVS